MWRDQFESPLQGSHQQASPQDVVIRTALCFLKLPARLIDTLYTPLVLLRASTFQI